MDLGSGSGQEHVVEAFEENAGVLYRFGMVLAGLVLPLLYLDQPLHVDEATFLVVGEAVREGATLYVDIADHKAPGIFVVTAALSWFGQEAHLAFRLLTYAVHLSTAGLVYALARRVYGTFEARVGSLAFLTGVYLPHFDGFFGLTEPYALLFLTAGAVLFLDDRRTTDFAAGLGAGVAALFNQTAFLFSVVFVAAMALRLRYPEYRTREYLRWTTLRTAVVGVGFALPSAAVLAYAASRGHLTELLRYTVVVPLTDYRTPFFLKGHLIAAASYAPIWWFAGVTTLVVGAKYVRDRTLKGGTFLLVSWFLLMSYPGATAFDGDHKLLFGFPAAAVLAAVGLRRFLTGLAERNPDSFLDRIRNPTTAELVAVGLAVALVGAVSVNAVMFSLVLPDTADGQQASAAELDGVVEEGSTVYTIPFRNSLVYYSDAEPARTFVGMPYSESLSSAVVNDLERGAAEYVVVRKNHIAANGQRLEETGLYYDTRAEIFGYVTDSYERVETTENYVVYQRTDGTDDG